MNPVRPKKHRTGGTSIPRNKGSKKRRTKKEQFAHKQRLHNPTQGIRNELEQFVYAFEEHDGEADAHPDPHARLKYFRKKKRKAIELAKHLFKFGFTLDGIFYYVDANGVLDPTWTRDLPTLIRKAAVLPKIGNGIHNLATDVWQMYQLTRRDYKVWIGEMWAQSDKVGSGMYGATIKRIEAYISRRPEFFDFETELTELKTIYAKLKGLLQAISQQQFVANGLLNAQKKSGIIDAMGNSFAASIMPTNFGADVADEDPVSIFNIGKDEEDGDFADLMSFTQEDTKVVKPKKSKKKKSRR